MMKPATSLLVALALATTLLDCAPESKGQLTVRPPEINFPALLVGATATSTIVIGNVGSDELVVEQLEIVGDVLRVFTATASLPLRLPPLGSLELEVRYTRETIGGRAQGTLLIKTTAANRSVGIVELSAQAPATMSPDAGAPPEPAVACPEASPGKPESVLGQALSACSASVWCPTHPSKLDGRLGAVWVSSATEAWAGGATGDVATFHRVGAVWTTSASYPSNVFGFWGATPNDLWATSRDMVHHWDGARWSSQPLPGVAPRSGTSIHGGSADNVWALGSSSAYRFDGTGWTPQTLSSTQGLPTIPIAVQAWSRDEAWILSVFGLYHFRRGAWSFESLQVESLPRPFLGSSDLWVGDNGGPELWIAAGPALRRSAGASAFEPVLPSESFTRIWGRSVDDLYAASGAQYDLLQWRPQTGWRAVAWPVNPCAGPNQGAWSIHSRPNVSEVLLASRGLYSYTDGGRWSAVECGPSVIAGSVKALWSEDSLHAAAINGAGEFFEWNGHAWFQDHRAPCGVRAMWGAHIDDLWVAAEGGVFHRGPGGWVVSLGAIGPMTAIHGAPDGAIWAVGELGVVATYDGHGWRSAINLRSPLTAVWAESTSIGYVANADEVFRIDGLLFQVEARVTSGSAITQLAYRPEGLVIGTTRALITPHGHNDCGVNKLAMDGDHLWIAGDYCSGRVLAADPRIAPAPRAPFDASTAVAVGRDVIWYASGAHIMARHRAP